MLQTALNRLSQTVLNRLSDRFFFLRLALSIIVLSPVLFIGYVRSPHFGDGLLSIGFGAVLALTAMFTKAFHRTVGILIAAFYYLLLVNLVLSTPAVKASVWLWYFFLGLLSALVIFPSSERRQHDSSTFFSLRTQVALAIIATIFAVISVVIDWITKKRLDLTIVGDLYLFMAGYVFTVFVRDRLVLPGMQEFAKAVPYLRSMVSPLIGFTVSYFCIVGWFAIIFAAAYQMDTRAFSIGASTGHAEASLWDFLYFSMGTILPASAYSEIRPASPLTRVCVSLETLLGALWLVVVFAAVMTYLGQRFEEIRKNEIGKPLPEQHNKKNSSIPVTVPPRHDTRHPRVSKVPRVPARLGSGLSYAHTPSLTTEDEIPGLVLVKQFAHDHHITKYEVVNAIRRRSIKTTRLKGKREQYLNPVQQRAAVVYWQSHRTPNFTRCDQCPHKGKDPIRISTTENSAPDNHA